MATLCSLLILLFLDQVGKNNANGPCSRNNYTTLNDTRRNIAYNETTDLCDRDLIKNGAWYRFQSTAGNEMLPEKNPGIGRCGTNIPIWMNGKHPTVDYVVTNVTACAQQQLPVVSTCYAEYNIKVVKCGSFFLYELKPPDQCNLAYCAAAEAREGFLIHQAAQNKCISIENEKITAKSCNPMTDNQRWRWTQYNQLQNILNQTCLSVRETAVDWVRLKLSTCNRHNKYQVWVCVNDLVRLNGTILNVNYGNAEGRDNVVLYQGTYQFSKWKVYGENVRVCEKRPQVQAGKGFLIYNIAHDKCISIENENITTRSCKPFIDNQRWRWTQYNQLQNILDQTCLSVRETPVNWVRLKLSTCNRHDKYQLWVCVNDFVRLNGTILNVNYGNPQGGGNVVLYEGIQGWSKWRVFGEDVRVCEERKATSTPGGNTTTPFTRTLHTTTVTTPPWGNTTTPSPVTSPTTAATTPGANTTTPSPTTSPTTTAQADKGFLIYNIAHNKCISIENEKITAKSCKPLTDKQRWRWTQYNQLQNILNQTFLSVREMPVDWVRLKLSTCNRHDKYQVWVCVNDLVRLNGTILNVNYGNAQGRGNVVLYQGIKMWSKWRVYGEDVRVCEKRKATSTPGGNTTTPSPTTLPTTTVTIPPWGNTTIPSLATPPTTTATSTRGGNTTTTYPTTLPTTTATTPGGNMPTIPSLATPPTTTATSTQGGNTTTPSPAIPIDWRPTSLTDPSTEKVDTKSDKGILYALYKEAREYIKYYVQ